VLYEDNDACTAMGNAEKPTPRTSHIDIKYFSICEWIEQDLMILECIDTTINMSDHLTKGLSQALFHRHADSYWDTSHQYTLLCTSPLLGCTLLNMLSWTSLFLHRLQHP
jgi:hypothetical protein